MLADHYGRSALCAQPPRFGERAFLKIILQGQFPDPGMQAVYLDVGYCHFALNSG